ncbi:MAG: tripartite tricarboxylate transporter TctB family protein [Hyphomicrobiales bacterium]
MNDTTHQSGDGPSHRTVEIGLAAFMALLGAITVAGSLQVGIGWGAEGPRSGFFPFYIGIAIILSSAVNMVHAFATKAAPRFAEWSQLRQVMAVVIPTTVYVFVLPYTGIYLASVVMIGVFMLWLGKYKLPLTAAVSLGVPLALYFMFEKWFLVPLPKGPIEDFLGL